MQKTRVWSLGWEDPLEKGMATPTPVSYLRNTMDRGAWQATVHGVTKESDMTLETKEQQKNRNKMEKVNSAVSSVIGYKSPRKVRIYTGLDIRRLLITCEGISAIWFIRTEGEVRFYNIEKDRRWWDSEFSSVAQSCPTPCNPMDCSTPGLPVHHQLPELAQTHVHWVGVAIQPSHPLLPPSPNIISSKNLKIEIKPEQTWI